MQLLSFLSFIFVFTVPSFTDPCPNGWKQSAIQPNKCLLVVAQKEIWFNAESFCQNAAPGAHLVSICSSFENSNIDAIVFDTLVISTTDPLWIGLNDIDIDGQFVWIDGSNCQYRNWLQGQPNISPSTQCISSLAKSTGKWSTENCGTENYFICEYLQGSSTTSTSSLLTSTLRPTTSITLNPTTAIDVKATDCYDLYKDHNIRQSGIYSIYPPGLGQISVFCEMEVDGGGWTVFQRRMDNTTTFYDKTWIEYKNGFNNGLDNNLWLGNDKIHVLSTKDANVELRIDLWGDRAPNASNPNVYLYGKYTSFSIDNEANYYTLHISYESLGNASLSPDSIYYNNGHMFSTIDVDHSNSNNCSGAYGSGGWWLGACSNVCLNGKYIPSVWQIQYGFVWYAWYNPAQYNAWYNPAQSRMMLRKLGM